MSSLTAPAWTRRPIDVGIPGPTPRDMATGFWSIRADPLSYLAATRERYGDRVAFPIPGPPALLLSDPDDVRRVLQTSARTWGKDTVQYAALGRVTGPGLLASSEPSWIDHRRLAAPAFHHQRLDRVGVHVAEATDEALARWDVPSPYGATVDVARLTLGVALDVVGRALFSADLSDQAHRLLEATSAAARLVVRLGRGIVPVPERIPTPLNRRLVRTRRELDTLCLQLIATRRATGVGGDGAGGDDLLGLLVDSGLSDQEIRDELVTMVIAGHETVAAALTWSLMLLAQDQDAQDRLRAEALAHIGPVPMVGTAQRLPWTRAVVDEALRLYPPAWVISRRSHQPDVLSGHDVPAGTTAIISPWLLHRRADAWPEPDAFRPERFLDRSAARSDYLPFGAGPRLCIGREFALGEMTIVLGRLLTAYRIGLPRDWSPPVPQALIAVHPRGGMPLHVTPLGGRHP
ncbi:cytochrome P450 [Luteipulveratus flavus]|uniref:Cytochrome P450 n=1 Tax=Luteipulveratus flavus TaxID=3031728 RepID=A0ABT6C7L1_9MICO|nr:cytochrome P450 [Luteipulveratus sp. YIM 133296]MDF8264848.1 cytochrome P450 [Luteipulveratus sp. YIM 133296]